MKNETKSKIQFGTGEDSVIHIVETDSVNQYLSDLANAGWRLNEITLIEVI
jgi:hypothetical protein